MENVANSFDDTVDDVAPSPLVKELNVSSSLLIAYGDVPIQDLSLSNRAIRGLWRRGLATIGQVLQVSVEYLESTPNLGTKSVQEIKAKIENYLRVKVNGAKQKAGSEEECVSFQMNVRPGESYDYEILTNKFREKAKTYIIESFRDEGIHLVEPDGAAESEQPELSEILCASPDQISRIANIPISTLIFSNRAYNCLMRDGIRTIGALFTRSRERLFAIRNFGQKSMEEIELKLTELLQNPTDPPSVVREFQNPVKPSLVEILDLSPEHIQRYANLPVSQLVRSKRALNCLTNRQLTTVSQLLCLDEDTLYKKYHLSCLVIDEIKSCLIDLWGTIPSPQSLCITRQRGFFPGHQTIYLPQRLCITWGELERKMMYESPDLFWNIPTYLKWWNASTEIDGIVEEALQKRQQLRHKATAREYTMDGLMDACQQLCREREWAIILARCGFKSNGEGNTLSEIAAELGVSRERIRQQEMAGLKRIGESGGIIGAFHKTLIWVFEQNEGILDMEHAAAELQKYFSPGGVSAANLCLLFCKACPEFNMVARVATQKLRDAMTSTEGPIYALGDKAEGFDDVIETARKLWVERESPIQSSEWLGQVMGALQENNIHLNSGYVLACLRADGRFDPARFDVVQKLPTLKVALVETLQCMGAPAHFTDICARLNEFGFLGKATSERLVCAALGRYPDLFVCIGKGTYGLTSWGLAGQRITRDRSLLIADIIEDFLEERDAPTKQAEIVDYVMQRKKCRDFSVSQRLANDPKFRRTAPGVYGLSKWYFGDATNVKTPTIKSTVEEALKRIGTPAHIRDIAKRLNQDHLMDRNIPPERVRVCLNSQRDIFVRVGMGIYGLASWGLEDERLKRDDSANIPGLIESFLEAHNEPATVKEIAAHVQQQITCSTQSVNGALIRDARFRRMSKGVYGLDKWFF